MFEKGRRYSTVLGSMVDISYASLTANSKTRVPNDPGVRFGICRIRPAYDRTWIY